MKNNLVYLQQIVDYIDQVDEYVRAIDFEEFEQNGLIQDAVIRKIEQIGETAKRLSVQFWKDYRGILPLAEAVSTRNRLIHQYDDIDLRIVWNTLRIDFQN
ncbi:MAG: DUF86 domain-containing protein [Anaerolineaceae bacterium]